MSRFYYRGTAGTYEVSDGKTGPVLGRVNRYERRFNLRRTLVVRGWHAIPAGEHHALRREAGREAWTYMTRTEAAEALLEHARVSVPVD
jgi:hypothetical protein